MESDFARSSLIGLVFKAGPIAFLAAFTAVAGVQAQAQEYIDVEAERRAAEQGAGAPTTEPGAVSYGVGSAPSGATTQMLPPPAAPAADNIGGLFNQVQQLQQEVMRLNGLVEQQAYELRVLKEQSLERYMDVDRRLAAGATMGPATNLPGAENTPATAGTTPTQTLPPVGVTGDRQALEQPGEGDAYRAAYALVRGQEFDQALSAFNEFLGNFPDGRYAPNAHYWLGELYLVIEPADPEGSRQAFMLLLNQYPAHPKVPDAMYKLGRVHFMKGNSERSREYLNRVIREHPDSSAARLAGDFLDQNL